MSIKDLNIKIFADGADINEMKQAYKSGVVKGFTTNPTLMKKAGIKNYKTFAKEVLKEITDMPISFEVFSDEFDIMEKEAKEIASWGKNVYVKIPITNSRGESSIPLIEKLSSGGIQLNVTAILTLKQVKETVAAFKNGTSNIVSVFAGRIADTGVNPIPYMKEAAKMCHETANTELLWASSRELLNIFHAEECKCDIITCTDAILKKIPKIGKDLEELSLDTVKMFNNDTKILGYSII